MNMIRYSLRKYAPLLMARVIGLHCASNGFAKTYPARRVRMVVEAVPDGHTKLMASSRFVVNPSLYAAP